MQNQKNIIILLAILLAISVNFNINYKKELQRIEELDQEMAWGHYDLYTFSLRQLTLDVKKYIEAKDQESLIQLVVQRGRVYDNYYQLIYKNVSANNFQDLSYAMKDFNWRILDFTHVIRHMDLQDIEDNKELILAINQHFSDSFYDFYEFTRNRATTMSVSVGGELIHSQPIRASVLDLFENQRELAKKVNEKTDIITPMIEELFAIVTTSKDANALEMKVDQRTKKAVTGYHIGDLGYGIYLQGFKIAEAEDLIQVGQKQFTLAELEDLLVFSDKDVLIYNITPLFIDKSFTELLTIYIDNLHPEVQAYDFSYVYEIGEYLSSNIQTIICLDT